SDCGFPLVVCRATGICKNDTRTAKYAEVKGCSIMNFDFSALNFETIDSNINAYPDMFLNQNGVTFTKKVLEDLGYPAYVLCLLDAKAKVFAIRMCKSNEPKGFKFSKPKGEQKGV